MGINTPVSFWRGIPLTFSRFTMRQSRNGCLRWLGATKGKSDGWCVPTVSHGDLIEWPLNVEHEEFMQQVQETGILEVTEVPGFAALRKKLLLNLYRFGMLPEDVQSKYCDKSSGYSFGWSRGVEIFEGCPDVNKGSFYANPLHDEPKWTGDHCAEYHNPNIWPQEVPQLEVCFKEMGSMMHQVGLLLADMLDSYLSNILGGEFIPGTTVRILRTSLIPKARGLVYYPSESNHWCGEHKDHGLLTGLVPGMFVRNGEIVSSPDPLCGLHIVSPDGTAHRVRLKEDSMAFQIGETLQVLSGGKLQATSHWVAAPRSVVDGADTYRISFAIFFQPDVDERLEWRGISDVGVVGWENGITFGGFAHQKFVMYSQQDP